MSEFNLQLETIRQGYDRQSCWVHARAGIVRQQGGVSGVVTMVKLRLSGDDVFFDYSDMRTDDGGLTWQGPTLQPGLAAAEAMPNGGERRPGDFYPAWHEASQTLIATGHAIPYNAENGAVALLERFSPIYSTYDADRRQWARWRELKLPDQPLFYQAAGGSTQRYDLSDGTILWPIYARIQGQNRASDFSAVIVRCAFDGQEMRYIEHGLPISVAGGRGLTEPSLTRFQGRYYLTIRNDETGYVATSDDGLNYDTPRPWCWDDGTNLGNYNTQQLG